MVGGDPENTKADGMKAVLMLVNHQNYSAKALAKAILDTDPINSHANYVVGVTPLLDEIRGMGGHLANKCESHLARASENGLAAVCAKPRAALRFDYFRASETDSPPPTVQDLIAQYTKSEHEAEAWPFGTINQRLAASEEFRAVLEP